MENETRRGGLTVGTGDTNHLRIRVTASELYLADDMDALGDGLADHRCRIGDARRLDNLVGRQHLFLRVPTFLPLYLVVIQQLLITVGNLRHV